MIIDKFIYIKGHPRNIKYYLSKGYKISVGASISVNPIDLSTGSTFVINCKCDNCHLDKKMQFREYYTYTKGLIDPYYCQRCKVIKSIKTNIDKYGVDNPMKSESVKKILKESIMEKYGVDHFSKTEKYKEKYKETCLKKYGVDNASKSEEVKYNISDIKFKQNNSIEKYTTQLPKEYTIINYEIDSHRDSKRVIEGIGINRNFKIYHEKCNSTFEIFIGTLSDRIRYKNIICTECNPIDKLTSSGEIEIKEFISKNGLKIVENSYEIIPPLSIDIYIPELKIAFEFNGVYWHSEVYKDKYYHINKSKNCEKLGINLIHIWEDDWYYKNEIIKSMILNKLKINVDKIFARKCEIREVNDIQGYSNSSIKIGLYLNGELVSLMTFGKKRKDMELVRFCSKRGHNIIGGSSKLFNYFIKNYKFDKIISYSDISFFDGKMYETLGFKLKHITSPNYWWVVDGIRKHRFNFTKKKISNNNNTSSEKEIMNNLGHKRIWGCGLKKWIWSRVTTRLDVLDTPI
jgi:hypothetical protein